MKSNKSKIRLALLLIVSSTPSVAAEVADSERTQRNQWTIYYAQQLPKYKFHLKSDPDTPLEVSAKAAFRWANPVRVGHTHGDLFIWTYKGRAAIVGTIFSYDTPGEANPTQRVVSHEFHSLSTETVVGTREGARLPALPGPGVKYEVVEGAPAPARTRPLRLAQMRRLSQEFEASIREGSVTQPLRLLSQPIYRYDTKDLKDDGAVFAYVAGTDPEVIMVLETQPTEKGPKWHFAAGRYAYTPLELKHKNKTVWEFEGRASHEGGYFSQHGIDIQPLVPDVSPGSE